MIKAECHSDDHNVEAEFDATPWFEQAKDKDLADLAECGWGGDYPADEVAEFMADRVERIAEMFKYLEIIHGDPSKKDCQGFECHVEDGDALKWILENRPHLLKVVAE
jgi:hypothetical protein